MFNSSSSPALTNCTFTANSAARGGGMYNSSLSPTLTNCILWGNTASKSGSQIYDSSSTPVVSYCDVQGGYTGTGNTNVDPQFVRAPSTGDAGDLRLRTSSPCIDAGKNSAVPAGIAIDAAGNPRFVDVPSRVDTGIGTPPIVDLGAYETPDPDIVIVGVNVPNSFQLSRSPAGDSIQIVGPNGTASYAPTTVGSVRFVGGTASDTLVVDFSHGNPLPTGGLAYDGGSGSNSLAITSYSGTTGLQQTATELLLGNSPVITFSQSTVVLFGTGNCSGGVTISGGALVLTSANALADGSSLTIGASASLIFGESLVPAMSASPAPFATGANSPTLGVSPPNANLAEGTAVDAVLASDLPLPTAASEMPRTRKLLPSLAQSHATTRTKLPAPPTTNRFGWWAIADALARKPKASLADKSVAAVDTLMQMYGKE